MNWNNLELPDNPYYQDDAVIIYHGDCREILPDLPKVDLVLTDPPYGINIVKKRGYMGMSTRQYDPVIGDKEEWNLDFLFTRAENLIIFGGNYFKLPISRGWLVWDKDHFAERTYGDVELIWTSYDKPTRTIKCQWDGFTRKGETTPKVHPTQKPIELIGKIIKEYSQAGDLILDPFLGSGTTAYCAKKLNRKCIGIEIEEKYCEIAAKRCCQTVMNFDTLKERRR